MIIPVILAGGYGERLWPLSTRARPKPFALRDASGLSLFQATVLRTSDRTKFTAPLVVCNEAQRFLALDQLRMIGVDDATLILESEARNTAPAIALTAVHVMKSLSNDLMLVMPADHQIEQPQHLLDALAKAQKVARQGRIITFAIAPTSAETSYGYIQRGVALGEHDGIYAIARFIEKPEREVAERLLKSGGYSWNSGMFLMRAACLLDEYARYAPEILAACSEAYDSCSRDGATLLPDAQPFLRARAMPFDRAIMERTELGVVMPLDMGWRDLGSWDALYENAQKDEDDNALTGEVLLKDVQGCHIYTDGAPIRAVGLDDMLVVAAHGQLLIAPRKRVAEIKEMQEQVAQSSVQLGITRRPWGHFQVVETGAHYQVKQLTVMPKGKISLQRHAKRSEHWVVVRGVAQVTRGQEQFMLYENQSTFIPAGEIHRLENPTDEPLVIIEVQTGSYLGEDDIERFEDIYARTQSA